MYFNLKNLKDSSNDTRPPEFYLNHGRATLQMEAPMVIFCDEITQPLIKDIRDAHIDQTTYSTVYIVKNFTDYDYYNQLWPIIVTNRQKSAYYKNPGDRNTPSYYLVTMFKYAALNIAHQRNDFKDATHYFWVDFGYSHVARGNIVEDARPMLANPKSKIGMLYIHYRSDEEHADAANICNKGTCGLATSTFSMEKDYVPKLFTYAWATMYEQISKGYGHADEQVINAVYYKNPELFNLHYGDYYSVISNYHYVKQDWNAVKWYFIMNALHAGRKDLAIHAAKNILESVALNLLSLPDEEKNYMEFVVSIQ